MDVLYWFNKVIQLDNKEKLSFPSVRWIGLEEQAKILVIINIIKYQNKPVLLICKNEKTLKKYRNILSHEIEDIEVFPKNERLNYEVYSQSDEIDMQRVRVLSRLVERNTPKLVLTTIEGIKHHIIPVKQWHNKINIQVGDILELKDLLSFCLTIGYRMVSVVEKFGEMSWRGGIFDIFPITAKHPIRVEFFADEIDSIRFFDEYTQRSINNIENYSILPAREFIFSEHNTDEWLRKLTLLREQYLNKEKGFATSIAYSQLSKVIEALEYSEWNPNIEAYYSILINQNATLLDYYFEKPLILVDDLNRFEDTIKEQLEDELLSFNALLDQHMVIGEQWGQNLEKIEYINLFKENNHMAFSLMNRHSEFLQNSKYIYISAEDISEEVFSLANISQELSRLIKDQFTIICTTKDEKFFRSFKDYLDSLSISYCEDGEIHTGQINLIQDTLSCGGLFNQIKIALLPIEQILHKKKNIQNKLKGKKANNKYLSIDSLEIGDYVVHESHGIGKYLGIEHIRSGEIEKDYLVIKYAGTDKLFIPVEQFSFLQKYVGQEGKSPKLNKLSGSEWRRTKQKVTESIKDLAENLLQIYAQRKTEPGFSFSPDDEMQSEFEAFFPYIETEDQLRAIEDVKNDMMKPTPMDRLICGDVGYGKTEVAMRGAFKAVLDGKQVAVLVPTTVLALQHFNTFKSRFEKFGARISCLSRFNSAKETKEIFQQIRDHQLDIVIGTHKLLNENIKFNDLGLLIIDEEQRFGVSHKERIKAIKTQVDVLTLSATPIPRTLHLSLAGIRDMSLIETPPENRFPIQTYVLAENDLILAQAIRRELLREGQIYIIQNNIQKLDSLVNKINKLVPEAKIAIAHGRMTDRQLEKVMVSFVHREADILVCTTIIETGLDIPNVNTLYVVDADTMGLSQLYQLRGRIGRSNRVAYAYLTYKSNKEITELAEKRLRTLRECTDLGSGYKVAMKDLQLRGAGNLLGAEQHGHVLDIGFDMYMDLLNEAVSSLTGLKEKHKEQNVEFDIQVNGFIPEEYIFDESLRLSIYRRLQTTSSIDDVSELFDEILDRFGDMPEPMINLFSLAKLRAMSREIGIKRFYQKNQILQISFYDDADISLEKLLQLIKANKRNIMLSNTDNNLILKIRLKQDVHNKKSLDSITTLLNQIK